MNKYADLEIGLHRRDAEHYQLELRFNRPDSETDEWLAQREALWVKFDRERLRALSLNAAEYGRQLSDQLFAAPEVRAAFAKAQTIAQTLDVSLRVRLFIGPSAPELHRLRWETLRDPQTPASLLTNETTLFARYLSSFDWRPVRLRPQADLRALVVIANPTDIADYQMAALNVADELARVKAGLGAIPVTAYAAAGQATLHNLVTALREGYDILYLVAHGMLVDDEPWLWLEQEDGRTQRVSGADLTTRLNELAQRPCLVVLASCQSAGAGDEAQTSDDGALAALGPRLAEAGIPAVVAMQGNITLKTLSAFMPVFFQELQRDGQIDRAMAAARGSVRERPDWWLPVLFMRLKSGRIWYTPGFAGEKGGLQKWPALLQNIRAKKCTPIIGPGLSEPLWGSQREIARRWAEEHHFPLAPYDREDLPQVAQYLSVYLEPPYPQNNLKTRLAEMIKTRAGASRAAELPDAGLEDLLADCGKRLREQNPVEPHRVLASLPAPIYITTDPSPLLKHALLEAGKEPQVDFCRWNRAVEYLEDFPACTDQPAYRPTEKQPLIYHLGGILDVPDSLVLTEDNYFDYLIGMTGNKELIPLPVRRALADNSLLFLGFQIDDWNFRVLFRSIMNREVQNLRAHVAAQITPEEGRLLEPERARRYLEAYFHRPYQPEITIYWGSVTDFMKELAKQLKL